ncbi:MAG: hypothetical protein KKF56_02875 [Nanoarchaeota archaeon]|nr:hypothetical protein [Nanoarchaeota archaeon]
MDKKQTNQSQNKYLQTSSNYRRFEGRQKFFKNSCCIDKFFTELKGGFLI